MGTSKERKKPIIKGRVKELRQECGLTQEKFAEEIEVATNTISRIEQGKMSLSSEVALKIADKYYVSLDWLFFRGEEQLCPACKAKADEAFACMKEQMTEELDFRGQKAKTLKLKLGAPNILNT